MSGNDFLLTELTKLKSSSEYFNNNNVLTSLYDHLTSLLSTNLIRMETTDTIPDKEFNLQESKKTIILYHQNCTKHGHYEGIDPIERIKRRTMQVENHERVSVLLQPPYGILLSDYFIKNCHFKESSTSATIADILLIHEYNYVESIKTLCDELKAKGDNSLMKYGKFCTLFIDSDTFLSASSYDAALHAVGCVIDAVDLVMNQEYSNALVTIRPPGHHAGYFGRVE
jgi:acetoin utilization deacetylase AcuC-like enzyme